MSTFHEVILYAGEKPEKAFSNYQQAEEAYKKHCARVANRRFVDPLWKHFEEYQAKYKDKLHDKHSSWYNFKEVKGLLKKHRLWGMQPYDERGDIDTTCILYDRYGVSIYCGNYGDELYVAGLNLCDFVVLMKAYRQQAGEEDFLYQEQMFDAYLDELASEIGL